MDYVELQLLRCLRAFRLGQNGADTTEQLSAEDWQKLHKLSSDHSVTPVVYEMLRSAPNFCGENKALAALWKRETILLATLQTSRTQQLLTIAGALNEAGILYAVVKGAICRQMYAKPDLRPSGDEDFFIPRSERDRCGEIFARYGLEPVSPRAEDSVDHWQHAQTGLHIELHTSLFSSGWPAEEVLNPYFEEELIHTIPVRVDQGQVQTLSPTVHFVFLISHALKHFIAGGFGLRTLCDILTFAERYHGQIDLDTVYELLDQINGRVFFGQLLAIGQAHLGFAPEALGWKMPEQADFDDLLADMLDAGIYGQTSMDRKHSAALALQAAQKGNSAPSLRSALFPPAKQLEGRYPVLRKAPVLLPVMWFHRMGVYALELLRDGKTGNSPRETMALGKRRTEMMVKYGILAKGKTKNR